MLKKPRSNSWIIFFTLLIFGLAGCGKKVDEKGPPLTTIENPQTTTEIELGLSKQELFCGSEKSCPNYLAKVAIVDDGKLSFCTGFLTQQDVLVTASSCLPEHIRFKDMSCDKDVFIFFAQANQKPLRVGCKRVLEASNLGAKEPFLWRSNVAYLKLDRELNNRVIGPVRKGMADKEKFYSWSIDQIDGHQGIIRQSHDCLSIHSTYFNPLSQMESSPVMTLAGCEYRTGNSGSPVLDFRGKVRGITSKPIGQLEIDEVNSMSILVKPLKPLVHVSSFACSPIYPDDEEVLNEEECNKVLDIGSYDLGKRELISDEFLFGTTMRGTEKKLNESNRYLQVAVNFKLAYDVYEMKIVPECFKNVSSWIEVVAGKKAVTIRTDIESMKIKKSMNVFGQISVTEIQRRTRQVKFQFKPNILRTNQRANVYMWYENNRTTFSGLSTKCDLLL